MHRKMVFIFLRRIQQSHIFLVSCILRSDCFISSQLLHTCTVHCIIEPRLVLYCDLTWIFYMFISSYLYIFLYNIFYYYHFNVMDISMPEIKLKIYTLHHEYIIWINNSTVLTGKLQPVDSCISETHVSLRSTDFLALSCYHSVMWAALFTIITCLIFC